MEKKASLVGRLLSENQMSEAFINSMFLALSGGFQDAYTYNCRDEVFSNAQTGNVVLMSQNFLEGNFTAGLRYLFPILFFAMGVFLAENFQEHYWYHWRHSQSEWYLHLPDYKCISEYHLLSGMHFPKCIHLQFALQ